MTEMRVSLTLDASEMMQDAICLLVALGRERLLATASGYLATGDPAEAAELRMKDNDDLALRAVCRAIVCGELDELVTAARDALVGMSPEQQLSAARERMVT